MEISFPLLSNKQMSVVIVVSFIAKLSIDSSFFILLANSLLKSSTFASLTYFTLTCIVCNISHATFTGSFFVNMRKTYTETTW